MPEDSLPTIAANPEDSSRYSRGGGRGRSRPSASSSFLVNAVLVILIAGLAGAGWFIFTQQEQLEGAKKVLAESSDRIARLESRLELTDEAMTSSDTDITEKVEEWVLEVDKLWANYFKHRDALADLGKRADALAASINRLDGDSKEAKQRIASIQTAIARQQDVADKVGELDIRTQRLRQDLRDAVDKSNAAFQVASQLEDSLPTKVAENETAIRAFDAHRAQINADLSDLRRDLDSLRIRVP